ncbi:hypothetical protein EON68_01065 [archaeon]|nr:MAG: hypothetical protein EON68_01065 [archaeon]
MEGPPPLPPPTDAKDCSIQGGEQGERRTRGGRDDDGEVELEREPHDDDAVAARQALTRTPLAQPAWMSGVATEDGLVHHRAKLLP